jgi:hypothetical protein
LLSIYKQEAAYQVADGSLSLHQIAKALGVSDRTLDGWCADPEFQALVQQYRNTWNLALNKIGFANKDVRLKLLNQIVVRFTALIRQRAKAAKKDPRFAGVPGADTGLLTCRERALPIGDGQYTTIYEFKVDTGTLAELRATLEHIAVEKGEWKRKIEHEGQVEHYVRPRLDLRQLGPERLETIREWMMAAVDVQAEPMEEPKPEPAGAPVPASEPKTDWR